VNSTNSFELYDWMVAYERTNKYQVNPVQRFAIAIYQIYQGEDWKTTDSSYESYAASIIHFIGTAVLMKVELDLPTNLNSFNGQSGELLYYISKAQQQIVYGNPTNRNSRSLRYSAKKLKVNLERIILLLCNRIPHAKMAQAFEDATAIITGVL